MNIQGIDTLKKNYKEQIQALNALVFLFIMQIKQFVVIIIK